MSTEANKSIVHDLIANLSASRVEEAFAQVADKASWTIMGRPDKFSFGGTKSKSEIKDVFTGFLSGMADFNFAELDLYAERNVVIAEVKSHGRSVSGPLYKNHYLYKFEFDKGKIINVSEFGDPFEVIAFVDQLTSQ